MSFKKILKDLRNEAGYTQKQLAKFLNISPTGYAGWEQGLAEPNITALIKLSQIFDVSIDCLLGCTDSENVEFYTTLPLSSEEREVLNCLRQLNKASRIKLMGYIEGLAEGQADVSNIKKGD